MIKLTDVFKTKGLPKYTYVSASDGIYEKKLNSAIQDRGTLCLITGPSKTGKTTLIYKVLESLHLKPVLIRCDRDMSVEDFWRKGLEAVDFTRIKERTHADSTAVAIEATIEGKLGWAWLAHLRGVVTGSRTKEIEDNEIREKILARPCPEHLLPILQRCETLLVIEDFHYLADVVQQAVFQQWKIFIDNEVSVVVLGTSHHACDLAYANKDLVGRISHLEMTVWFEPDLREIAKKGFATMRVLVDENCSRFLAEEAVGLPIIMQAACAELLRSKGITTQQPILTNVPVTRQEARSILHEVATTHYGQLEGFYDRIKHGLNANTRRYQTYEFLLSIFTLDPIAFSLKRHEIRERIKQLPMPSKARPPEGSVKHALGHLKEIQTKMGAELMEWVIKDDRLFVVEPAFLFYLRWREKRKTTPDIYDLFKSIFKHVEIVRKSGYKSSIHITLTRESASTVRNPSVTPATGAPIVSREPAKS